jgi:Lar family restriction alleviation protein
MPKINLKPCPFCGRAAITSFQTVDAENRQQYGWIGCRKCGVRMEYYNLPGRFEEAAEKWNRRVSE